MQGPDTLCISKVVSNRLAPLSQKWTLIMVNGDDDGMGKINRCIVPGHDILLTQDTEDLLTHSQLSVVTI